MNAWKSTKLKHIAAVPIANGLGEKGEFDNPSWPRYVRTTDIASATELRSETFRSLPPEIAKRAMLRPGDVLMTAAGATIGKSFTYKEQGPACYAGYLVRFRPKQEEVDGRFVAYWMQSAQYWAQINAQRVKSTIENFSASRYQNLELLIPGISPQNAIADYLDAETAKIDALIARKQRMVDLCQSRLVAQQSQLILRNIDPISGNGMMTAGWRLMNLGTLVTLQRGHDLPWAQRVEGDVPVVSSGGTSGTHNVAACAPPGVVTGRYGTIGEVFWLDVPYWPLNTTLYVRDFRGNDPRWVYHLLRALPLNFDEEKSAVTGINRNVVGQLRVDVPPLNEQREIADQLDQNEAVGDALIEKTVEQIGLLQERRQVLITAAVTGQLDIPEGVRGNH